MAIRLRVVDGTLIALCAAKTVAQEGDVYLDDNQHGALACKFARDELRHGVLGLCNNEHHNALVRTQDDPGQLEWWRQTYVIEESCG